jgi:hypothetical protein
MALQLLAALALAWGGFAVWAEWSLAAVLWFVPGFAMLFLIPIGFMHHVFGNFPPEMPDQTRPGAKCNNRSRTGGWLWVVRRTIQLAAIGALGLLAARGWYALAGAWVAFVLTGSDIGDQIKVARAGWDSRVLPPLALARYIAVGVFFHLIWGLVRLGWFLLKLPFRPVAAAWRYCVWLYGASKTFRYLAIGLGVILILPFLPFYLLWQLYCGVRDSRALRAEFDRPEGLVYFVYSEPHQFEHFMGQAGVLDPARSAVVARDWRLDLGREKQRPGWAKSPEGRMLNHLMVRSLRTDLPLVVVARPWRVARVHQLSAPYRARLRDAGEALAEAETRLTAGTRWARETS